MRCTISLPLFLLLWVRSTGSNGESQFLGYELDNYSESKTDSNVTDVTLLTDVRWSFPSDGVVKAFHVRLHGYTSTNDVIIQIWRPHGNNSFSLVGQSNDVNVTLGEIQDVTSVSDVMMRRGDVMGIYFPGNNPVLYEDEGDSPCEASWVMYRQGQTEVGDTSEKVFKRGTYCRRFLVTAEYQIQHTDLRMDILGDDLIARPLSDNITNTVLIPNSDAAFPVHGQLHGWKAYLEEANQQVTFQVWRPVNSSYHVQIHESPPLNMPITGSVHVRLRPDERVTVIPGDVIALGHAHRNPVHYSLGESCEGRTLVKQPVDGERAEFRPWGEANACRHYSFQAEYHRSNLTLPPQAEANASVETSPTPSTSESNELTSSQNLTTLALPTTQPPTPTTPTTPTPITNTTLTTTELVSIETSTNPPLSPTESTVAPPGSTVAPSVYFGWDVKDAWRRDDVQYGTVIPDVGKVFHFDGKVIGWEFNVSHISYMGYKIGFQVWRPMSRHPKLFPHGRDFAFVGETKPVDPWHVGLNSFHVSQVGQAPIHIRAGDVIAFRINGRSPVTYAASTDCTRRYYMDNHGSFQTCDQQIFQTTEQCRVYPVKAMVIWDTEHVSPAEECVDISESLVPSKPTHIDGCLILNIESTEASYRLTNPDYPNITKHRDLCWVIQIDRDLGDDLYIQVTINDFDLHAPRQAYKCSASSSDFLEIRDGSSGQSELLRRYCVGWPAGNDVSRTDVTIACQRYMYLRMRTSRDSFTFKGFQLHYQAVNKEMLHRKCVRYLPLAAPNAARSRNAAIITILVVVVVIATVFLVAYVRKHGLKSPRWLSFIHFKHKRFDNPTSHGIHSISDSPSHNLHQPDPPPGGVIANHSEYQLQRDGFDAAYVQFSPGGYPHNTDQAVLRIGNIDSKTANASSIMEGVSELPEVTNGVISGQRSGTEVGQDGGDEPDLFPPPSESFRNNNVTILPSHHVNVDREPNHSVT